ncbi:hypothetical protein [Ruminococcus albus]|uniref:Peptidase C39-like domain-containing protein n=1 Tax=Ruminococcus albus 8 TaxID=246199 RepID=E9SI47_RUMAL|nr:hypothetical protein [Ruminococcus albus]EGC01041.1 hypothetical protein CUS_4496 [Ruminococcus albus 8]MCC3351841.1 hypothetical protein [Ruminococcus albus 8]
MDFKKIVCSLSAAAIMLGAGAYPAERISASAMTAASYSTSESKPAIIQVLKAKYTLQYVDGKYKSTKNSRIIRRGFYTGYQIRDNLYVINVNYNQYLISTANTHITAVSNSRNSINLGGAISQLGECESSTMYVDGVLKYNGRHDFGCGQVAACTVINNELDKDLNITKGQLINEFKYDKGANPWAGSYNWGYTVGTPMYGIQYMINSYARKYGKSTEYCDTYSMDQKSIISQIDKQVEKGHNVLCGVYQWSDFYDVGTEIHYKSQTDGVHCTGSHYVVILCETGDDNGYYYIADPYYAESNSDPAQGGKKNPYNGYNYYYGLQRAKKSEVAASIQGLSNREWSTRGLIYIK